jgi:hypothetical protein
MPNNAPELLKQSRVEVAPETYFLIALRDADWHRLLESPELSPRMTAPFMILRDKYEVTLLLDEVDFQTCRHALREAKIESGFRLLTFDLEMDFTVVGFMAEVSRILAAENIPIFPISAFSRDHILIKQNDLAKALKALGDYVAELC